MVGYIGTARNVRELLDLLKEVSESSTLELQGDDRHWEMLEVWYNKETDIVIIK